MDGAAERDQVRTVRRRPLFAGPFDLGRETVLTSILGGFAAAICWPLLTAS
jgi:hypothetical protein